MQRSRAKIIVFIVCMGLGIAISAFIVWESLPRSGHYVSVHPMSTVPPLSGFSTESVFNTGTEQQLDAFPGIGEVLAARIIEGRETYGPYRLPTDLLLIKGIGTKTVAAIVDALAESFVELQPAGE